MSPSNELKPGGGRIPLLDAWRGVAVILMVGWHFMWDLTTFGAYPQENMFGTAATLIRYFIVFSFLLLSGISCRFSRSNARRGAMALLCAMTVSVVTYLVGDPVRFGILHLLGCCMLLYAAVGPYLERLPGLPVAAVCLLLFAVTFRIPTDVRVDVTWTWMFGFRTTAFYSSDYYPLIPWGFLFFVGAVLGDRVRLARERLAGIKCPAALCWIGRRALWIYMLHQPVLYVLTAVCTGNRPF